MRIQGNIRMYLSLRLSEGVNADEVKTYLSGSGLCGELKQYKNGGFWVKFKEFNSVSPYLEELTSEFLSDYGDKCGLLNDLSDKFGGTFALNVVPEIDVKGTAPSLVFNRDLLEFAVKLKKLGLVDIDQYYYC